MYYIGLRSLNPLDYLNRNSYAEGIECSVATEPYLAEDFAGAARKYATFTGSYSLMDMAALIERLMLGIVTYANTGSLKVEDLRGGGEVSVVSLGAAARNITAGKHSVFIPRGVDRQMSPNVFCALANAVSGCGGTVITDIVEIDASTNKAKMAVVRNGDLADGCYDALLLLGGNYEHAGAGDIFSLAVTTGTHKALSVVGHSDEGGYMREVLRNVNFGIPYGGISSDRCGYTGLPRPALNNLKSFQMFVDSIALQTAGNVAICDPLMRYEDNLYPTVIASDYGDFGDAGVSYRGSSTGVLAENIPHQPNPNQKGMDAQVNKGTLKEEEELDPNIGSGIDARRNAAAICEISADFSALYVKALMLTFAQNGNSGCAQRSLEYAFVVSAGKLSRHLAYKVVAPFFWIEPTSVVCISDESFPAVANGYGPLAYCGTRTSKPMFEDAEVIESSDVSCVLQIKWRSARTSALLQHLQGNPLDGLSCIQLLQADADKFTLLGGKDSAVSDRINNALSIDKYLWGRWHSGIIHPAECTYLGGDVALRCVNVISDISGFKMSSTHLPMKDEMLTGNIDFWVSIPYPMDESKLQDMPRDVKRSRARAAWALRVTAKGLARILMDNTIPISTRAPTRRKKREPDVQAHERVTLAAVEANVVRSNIETSDPAYANPSTKVEKGETKTPMVLQEPMRGPTFTTGVRPVMVSLPTRDHNDLGGGGGIEAPETQ
jgi:hypothetical protein